MRKKFKRRNTVTQTKKTGKKRKKHRFLFKLLLFVVAVIALLVFFDARLGSVITTIAQYQCQSISILAINDAVIDELEKSPELTSNLLTLQRNIDGTVTSITVNTDTLNELKARLTSAVSHRLEALDDQNVSVPLGTLIGWQLVSGRGPNINLKIVPTSFVQSTTKNMVTTAGINQTQHSIVVQFTVEMSALLPGYSTSIVVQNDVTVSETLIVGEVPMFYSVS